LSFWLSLVAVVVVSIVVVLAVVVAFLLKRQMCLWELTRLRLAVAVRLQAVATVVVVGSQIFLGLIQ
jgi:hypothetical protein